MTFKKLLLILNECAVLLIIPINTIFDVVKYGIRILASDSVLFFGVCILLCALLPLALKKPGFLLSKVLAGIGAFAASVIAGPLVIAAVQEMLGLSIEPSDVNGIGLLFIVVLAFLYILNVCVSITAALEWVEERREYLPQRELRKLEKHADMAGKIFAGVILAVSFVFLIWFLIECIRENWGRSPVDIGKDAIIIIVMSVLMAAPYVFVMFLFSWIGKLLDRPNPKEERRKEALKTVETCLEKETIRDDMEALTLLERSQSDTLKKETHSRAAFYVMISLVRYRLGDFDRSKESIKEALALYEKIVRQEGGESDGTLYMKAMLYDVSCRISGTLRNYGQKLDNCKLMLRALDSSSTSYANHSEKGRAYSEMADALCGLGQHEEALKACDQAAAELDQLTSQESSVAKSSYALLNRVRAKILLDLGRIEEAEECAARSIELYSGMNESYDNAIGASHLIMGKIQSELGNSERAEKEYLIAESLIRDRYGVNHPIYKASQR